MWKTWSKFCFLKQDMFPMYGVVGDGDGNWDVDIFWGNAKIYGARAVQHVKRFKPDKVDPAKVQAQSAATKLSKKLVEDAFKAHESFIAKAKAIKYMEKMRRDEPVRDKPMPESYA